MVLDISVYVKKMFSSNTLSFIALFFNCICWVIFPTSAYLYSAGAVLALIAVDLITKLYSLSKIHGGFCKGVKTKHISSQKFGKGTIDKMVVLLILLIICGLAYRITPVVDVAVWFMQFVFIVMFLREAISYLENLCDAGIGGLDLFKDALNKKLKKVIKENEDKDEE